MGWNKCAVKSKRCLKDVYKMFLVFEILIFRFSRPATLVFPPDSSVANSMFWHAQLLNILKRYHSRIENKIKLSKAETLAL